MAHIITVVQILSYCYRVGAVSYLSDLRIQGFVGK